MLGLGLVLGLFPALLDMLRTRSPMFDRLQRRNNSHSVNWNVVGQLSWKYLRRSTDTLSQWSSSSVCSMIPGPGKMQGLSDMELGHWVIWVIFHVRVTGSPGHHFNPDPSFSDFRKKCPKRKTYIWNAEMTKVIVRCLLLDWNHWMSVHAMNFYFYL